MGPVVSRHRRLKPQTEPNRSEPETDTVKAEKIEDCKLNIEDLLYLLFFQLNFQS